MKNQRGLSLTSLMFMGVLFGIVALLGAKCVPAWSEYGAVKKAVIKTANNPDLKEASIAEVRKAYDKFAEIDNIKSMPSGDLEITKEGGQLVISFKYESRIPLVANASLLFDFQGSSTGKDK